MSTSGIFLCPVGSGPIFLEKVHTPCDVEESFVRVGKLCDCFQIPLRLTVNMQRMFDFPDVSLIWLFCQWLMAHTVEKIIPSPFSVLKAKIKTIDRSVLLRHGSI